MIEITGIPCSGKSSWISSNDDLEVVEKARPEIHYFYLSFYELNIPEIMLILKMSLREKASFIFRLYLFWRVMIKFGRFHYLITQRKSNAIVDEGITHVPFNFLESEPKDYINILESRVSSIDLYFKPIGKGVALSRLNKRGHTRLAYVSPDYLIERCIHVSNAIKPIYLSKCKSLTIIEE